MPPAESWNWESAPAVNLEHYPATVDLWGLDLSRRTLERASLRRARGPRTMHLVQGDAESLPFGAAAFAGPRDPA